MIASPPGKTSVTALDFSDFAQEFLRRNPAYIEQFDRLGGNASAASQTSACLQAAQSWGLAFPHRSATAVRQASGLLAS